MISENSEVVVYYNNVLLELTSDKFIFSKFILIITQK